MLPPIDMKFDSVVGHHQGYVAFKIGGSSFICPCACLSTINICKGLVSENSFLKTLKKKIFFSEFWLSSLFFVKSQIKEHLITMKEKTHKINCCLPYNYCTSVKRTTHVSDGCGVCA